MRARLIAIDAAPTIELVKEITLVGRTPECDIRIDHKSVSKMHCILVKTDGLVLVRDLGSTNGTRVNGQRVRRAALFPNDHLAIAALRYQLMFGEQLDPADRLNAPEVPEEAQNLEGSGDFVADDPDAPVNGPPLRVNSLPDFREER